MEIKKIYTTTYDPNYKFDTIDDCKEYIKDMKEDNYSRYSDALKFIDPKHDHNEFLYNGGLDIIQVPRYQYDEGGSAADLIDLLQTENEKIFTLPDGNSTDIIGAIIYTLEHGKNRNLDIDMVEECMYISSDGFEFFSKEKCEEYESAEDKSNRIFRIG